MTLLNNWNTEDCNALANEVTTEWEHELKNEYYAQEADLSSHDTNWDSVGGDDADFSTETFDDLLFLLNSWSANTKSNNDINSFVQIEMICRVWAWCE